MKLFQQITLTYINTRAQWKYQRGHFTFFEINDIITVLVMACIYLSMYWYNKFNYDVINIDRTDYSITVFLCNHIIIWTILYADNKIIILIIYVLMLSHLSRFNLFFNILNVHVVYCLNSIICLILISTNPKLNLGCWNGL